MSFDFQDRYKDLKNQPCPMDKVTRVGEKLTFAIKWNGVPAGTSVVQVKRKARIQGQDAYVLEMHNESNDFLSVIYEVNSTIKSFVDVKDGRSYLFRRNLKEGKHILNSRQEFDYLHKTEDGKIEAVSRYCKIDKDGKTVQKPERPIPGPLQDPLSIVYYMRSLPFDRVGQAHQVLLGARKRTDVTTITARKIEPVSLGSLGRFDTIVVEPAGEEGVERDNLCVAEGNALVWLEKNTRIPLQLSVKVPIGRATATLVKAEGTDLDKYALTGAASAPAAEPTD